MDKNTAAPWDRRGPAHILHWAPVVARWQVKGAWVLWDWADSKLDRGLDAERAGSGWEKEMDFQNFPWGWNIKERGKYLKVIFLRMISGLAACMLSGIVPLTVSAVQLALAVQSFQSEAVVSLIWCLVDWQGCGTFWLCVGYSWAQILSWKVGYELGEGGAATRQQLRPEIRHSTRSCYWSQSSPWPHASSPLKGNLL